jgi:hypothetical protein
LMQINKRSQCTARGFAMDRIAHTSAGIAESARGMGAYEEQP